MFVWKDTRMKNKFCHSNIFNLNNFSSIYFYRKSDNKNLLFINFILFNATFHGKQITKDEKV